MKFVKISEPCKNITWRGNNIDYIKKFTNVVDLDKFNPLDKDKNKNLYYDSSLNELYYEKSNTLIECEITDVILIYDSGIVECVTSLEFDKYELYPEDYKEILMVRYNQLIDDIEKLKSIINNKDIKLEDRFKTGISKFINMSSKQLSELESIIKTFKD